MKMNLIHAALAVLALSLPASAAFAGIHDPISGVPVGLEHDPGGIVVVHGVTSGEGQFSFGDVKPGKYLIVIDGRGLALALKKIDPKGLPHTIHVTFGLAGQKPLVFTNQPFGGDAASLRIGGVTVAVGDLNGDGVASKAKPHNYVGIVSLLK